MKALSILLVIFLAGCGPQGPQGPTGPTGPQGPSCTVVQVGSSSAAPNGGAAISCPDNTMVLVLNGSNGLPGTAITPVQFCPNATIYPTTFSEVGFCIGTDLYAVYSANGGFLSKIPYGGYGSNGINSSCSFTIGANCSVTH